jgi:hypothetical protein
MSLTAGGEQLQVIKGKIENLSSNPEEELKRNLEEMRKKKLQVEKNNAITTEFDQTFLRLGELLFPDFVGNGRTQNLEIVEEKGAFFIRDAEKPVKPKPNAFPWQIFADPHTPENYSRFVQELFHRLETHADSSQTYKTAAGRIEAASRGSGNESPEEMVQRWRTLAERSKEEGWSRENRFPMPSGSKTNREAEGKLEIYSSERYFTAFFRNWESVFSNGEKTKQLVEYLKQPNGLDTGASVEELKQQIEQLEFLLKQLQSADIMKNLQVSFHYTWEEPKPNSPDKDQKSFLVLQSKPDETN